MDPQPSHRSAPSQRDRLLSLPARCFLSSWRLTIRCACKVERRVTLPELATTRLSNREKHTLGDLVHRLVCQLCGQRPSSVIAEHEASNVREEMVR